MRPNNREKILRAAEKLILQHGVGAFTLEDVASSAGMSKGGVFYHFKTKDELIHHLLVFAFDNFEAAVDRLARDDSAPGAWLRAYVRATFDTNATIQTESLASAALILAYFGRDSAVRELYETAHGRWSKRAGHDGVNRAVADVIRMAADGLWLAEALGVSGFDKARKRAFVEQLIALTEQAPG
ncbi:MAG TPA: TetR/AcrR family transcriptional regulator [Trinickia sp.]|uniref:TetR/AcrR family transcriptional regulator n=1 Tax=Trinickia sp. TaxID=2571163 RepID=UPI002C54F1F7|nr:TetR/AcrR family transcriptional regulator [Trinickia sp.]HVW52182.1 TetR/AcrR family transcriptional regulator [Trinickia sp.]